MSGRKATIAERLSDLLTSGKFSDTEFIFRNGETVKGHKLIFAIASPVFEAMLYGDLAENETEIKVDDIEPDDFKTMTKFIYSDNVQLDSVSHAVSLYKAADKYDLPYLRKKIFDYITLNVQANCVVEVLEFSKLYDVPFTEMMCLRLLREQTKDVIASNYALKCSIDTLQTIVDRENLRIPEVELFKLVENWAKCYAESNDVPLHSVKPLLKKIISKIRFLTMSVTEFLSSPFVSDLLSVEEKHSLVLNLNQPNSAPLPENFCDSTKFRDFDKELFKSFTLSFTCVTLTDDQYLVQWRLKNLSEIMVGNTFHSPNFNVGHNQFKILFHARTTLTGDRMRLCFFLRNDSEEEVYDAQWSSNLVYDFKLSLKERDPIIKESRSRSSGFASYGGDSRVSCIGTCNWTKVLIDIVDSEDDYILIEVDLKKK